MQSFLLTTLDQLSHQIETVRNVGAGIQTAVLRLSVTKRITRQKLKLKS
jgi:hypothetical protein